MTPPPDDDPPPPPRRRRKPPKGLEGFDTGYPEDNESAPTGPTSTSPASGPTSTSPASDPTSTSSASGPTPVIVDPTSTGAHADLPVDPMFQYASPAAVDPAAVDPAAVDPAAVDPAAPLPTDAALDRDPSTFPVFAPGTEATSGAMAMSAWTPPTTESLDRDEPLSAAYVGASDAELRDAVGASTKKKRSKRARTEPASFDTDADDDLDGTPRSRKMIIVSAVSIVFGLGIAALVFLGRANSAWYYVTCETDRIIAQQGRAFPPWGETSLGGKQWAAIKIPPDAECIPLETESEDEVSDRFRALLVKRASVLLTAKEVTNTGEAKALLDQALLHARSNTDRARDARTEIQRLLGDVAYWGASLKMRDASKALLDAATEFETAAQQRPRHVTDAAAWAEYVRKVVGELASGPAGASEVAFPPAPPPPTTEPRQPAPPGVALPVEPEQGSASEAPPPATPPDAGLPTGGVLL